MISPEILAEQVMGYVVGASELIPTLKPVSKPHSIAILPQGPHFYTWLLQAAGYLLLDSQKKKLLMISQQVDDPNHILIDINNHGTILGQNREKSSTDMDAIARQFGAKVSTTKQESVSHQLRFQLPFLRVITQTEEFLHISVGKNISETQIKKLISQTKKHAHDHNVVLLTNIELTTKPAKKTDEQKQITKSMEQTFPKNPVVNIFQKLLASQKKKAQIIAYVNPGDFGEKSSLMTRYVCAVG